MPDVDHSLNAARDYVRHTSASINSAESAQQKKMAKGKNFAFDPTRDKRLTIFVANTYPPWQARYVDLVREAYDGKNIDMKTLSPKIGKLGEAKKAMPFVQALKRQLEAGEDAEAVFERRLLFDELTILNEMVSGLRQTVQKCRSVVIVSMAEDRKAGVVMSEGDLKGQKVDLPPAAESAVPGNPSFLFENIQ